MNKDKTKTRSPLDLLMCRKELAEAYLKYCLQGAEYRGEARPKYREADCKYTEALRHAVETMGGEAKDVVWHI